MKYKLIFFCFLTLLIISNAQAGPLQIVTTTQDAQSITKAIAGDKATIHSLTKGTRDPHFAEAKPSMIRKVHAADLLMLIGAELETAWLPSILRAARNRNIQPGTPGYLDLSQHVHILGKPSGPIDRSMGDVHASGNPHYWLNPENGILMAQAIMQRLSEIDEDNKIIYQTNFDKFKNDIENSLITWQKELEHLRNTPVIVYHKSLIYLAQAFGFKIVKEVEPKPGISPGAAHLAELVSIIKNQKINYLLIEPYYEKRSASFYPDGRLRHVGFLGAAPPAVKGLAGIAFGQEDKDRWA